jgi:hypothetical protein
MLPTCATSVLAAPTAVPESLSPDADTSGGFVEWITNNLYTYDHFIQVCTYQWNTDFDNRVADAAAEWTEKGGELGLIYAGWSDSTCLANLNAYGNIVFVTSPAVFRGFSGDFGDWVGGSGDDLDANTSGQTCVMRTLSGGSCGGGLGDVDYCMITLDMNNQLDDWGTYSWYAGTGSPSSSQLDAESVLVHEMGHCLAALGHTTHAGSEDDVMDDTLGGVSGGSATTPKGVEKDEVPLPTHDGLLYTSNYGTTH